MHVHVTRLDTTVQLAGALPRTPLCEVDPDSTEVVTFTTPEGVECTSAGLVGDFTAWAPVAMNRNADGTHSTSIRLDQARRWRYQFLLDGDRLINDWSADEFVTLADGRCASVVAT